jgi:hypothetical protein
MIIGLSGYARSGKDTVADYLVENYAFKRVAFADGIRDFLLTINPFIPNAYFLKDVVEHEGWDVAKSMPYVRKMLQDTGVYARDNWGASFWINHAFRHMDKNLRDEQDELHHIVITDVRFKNEADAISGWVAKNGTLIRVNRTDVNPINNHISETDLDDYVFKHILDNDSDLFDLHLKVEELMREFNIPKK